MNEFIAGNSSERLDKFLSEKTGNSRSEMAKYIDEGFVFVNGVLRKPSYKTKEGDVITYREKEPVKLDILPENIPIDIVYEDGDIIAINKQRGMIVHPSGNIVSGTLVNALLYHTDELSDINGVLRPGIVHRLDKDTTGLLLVAKNKKAHLNLAREFQERSVKKIYYALVFGGFKDTSGEIELPIARHKIYRKKMAIDPLGRYAKTLYKVVKSFNKYSLLRVQILTGRTHQIRVHMAHIGHPVVGDQVYHSGKNEFGLKAQLLHSYEIAFKHPVNGETMKLSAKFPEDFKSVLEKLNKR